MAVATIQLYRANSQVILLNGVVDGETGVVITGATLTGTVVDGTGTPVTGATTISFTDQGGGVYRMPIGPTFSPAVGTNYTLQVSGTDSSGDTIYFEKPVSVVVRQV